MEKKNHKFKFYGNQPSNKPSKRRNASFDIERRTLFHIKSNEKALIERRH